MTERKKIYTGLAVFFLAVAMPVWLTVFTGNCGKAREVDASLAKALETARKNGPCLEPAATMRVSHMQILDRWRDLVVRENQRTYVSANGVRREYSLTKTCLDCHGARKQFCDVCHDRAGVSPFCWNCHNDKGAH